MKTPARYKWWQHELAIVLIINIHGSRAASCSNPDENKINKDKEQRSTDK